MVVTDALAKHVIPLIHACSQLYSVYVLRDNVPRNGQWSTTLPKVKGLYTRIEPIWQRLQADRKRCDRDQISISIHGVEPLFMYTQLFKEALLTIDGEDDANCIKEFVDYCRLQEDISRDNIEKDRKRVSEPRAHLVVHRSIFH